MKLSDLAVLAGGAMIYEDQYPNVSYFSDVDLISHCFTLCH